MTVPKPPIKLAGHCSVIHDNTLYAFSPDGFAFINLRQNETWHKLPSESAKKVSGAACVVATVENNKDEDALYVIGGTDSSSDYSGLQRYSFANKKWEILKTGPTDMTNRTSHGVGYLPSSTSIVVYGGDKNKGGVESASTFLISTNPPYDVQSQPSQGPPAVSQAVILPWNASAVAMVSVSESNKAIYVYGDKGWAASGASLANPAPESAGCALITGSDGSKVLEEFHLDESPNTVTSYALVTADGQPASPAGSTNAPSTKRSNYSVAQDSNGMVVFSSDNEQHSLSIFNSTSNGWVNATEFFHGTGTQHVLKASSTPSSSSAPTSTSSTSTPSSTSTSSSAPAAAAGGGHTPVGTIVGATLGSICGLIVILLAILFFLRRARQKKEQAGQVGGGHSKDRLSFQDQGIEPLTEGAYPMAKSPVPVAAGSHDSFAIVSGNANGEKSLKPPNTNVGYGLSNPTRSSPLSTVPSSSLEPEGIYSDEPSPGGAASENKAGDRTTDEGWGKYFEDNGATNLSRMQSDRSTASSVYTKSDYRNSAWPMTNLTPLNFAGLDQPKPLGRVLSGSPTTATPSHDRSLVIPEGQSARISSADSISLASEDDPHDTRWTGAGQSSWFGRPSSSNYSMSFYNSSTRDVPAAVPRQNPPGQAPRHSNGRRSSVVIPDDIDELSTPGHGQGINTDVSWLNLQAGR
ncbi:hypothetical protein N7492_010266 [Penicillium capsulatum]|uniref:Pre-mRNA splicing factor CLF1 n=1 Tax=Penicillium capsulatum TaxID=69766 RepID=A0A9W9LDQ9_9EURO|nr:hypothetical protein N7492_010266 [Penicillium capsulatum]